MNNRTWYYQRSDCHIAGIPYICIIYPSGSCFIRLDEYTVTVGVPGYRTQSKTYKVKFKLKAIWKAYKKVLPFSQIYVFTKGLSDDEKAQIEEFFGKWNVVYEHILKGE